MDEMAISHLSRLPMFEQSYEGLLRKAEVRQRYTAIAWLALDLFGYAFTS